MDYKICLLPGDGIGPEVVAAAVEVLKALEDDQTHFQLSYGDIGGGAFDKTGRPLPEDSLSLAQDAQAILLGAVGGPKWDQLEGELRPEQGLLALRKNLGVYTNLRPCKVYRSLLDQSPVKPSYIEGTDALVVRELVGGIYFGKRQEGLGDQGPYASDEERYSSYEIDRIARQAFDFALKRKKKVTLVDKANVLVSSKLWRKVVANVAKDYPGVKLETMYVDNCAMQVIRNPRSFDVVLTNNIFGDILSDEFSQVAGSIGLLPSASLGDGPGLYEPVHGSAPDLAGKNLANPLGTILSLALLLRYSLKREDLASQVEGAVEKVLDQGLRTYDLDQESFLGTREMGQEVVKCL